MKRWMASPGSIGSLIRTAMPPRSALAAPTPMNQVPSVVMNDGLAASHERCRSRAPCRRRRSSTTDAEQSVVVGVRPVQHENPQHTAAEVSTPSTLRSIDPIRMMKVAPIPSTSGIIAVWLMRTALPKERKFGLIAAMMAQSATAPLAAPRPQLSSGAAPRVPCRLCSRGGPSAPAPGKRGRASARAETPLDRMSCTGSVRSRGPRCRPSRVPVPS